MPDSRHSNDVETLLSYIDAAHPLHAKKVEKNLASTPGMRADLEGFLATYAGYMAAQSIDHQLLAQAYLTMVDQMTAARIDFVRTGKYPAERHDEAIELVYANPSIMRQYMLGLALSQFLWRHHYLVFTFFQAQVRAVARVPAALEVGSGHGLFLLDMLRAHPEIRGIDVVDISKTSLQLTKDLIDTIAPEAANRLTLVNADVGHFTGDARYDFITMGEVLEHLPNPGDVLRKLKTFLTANGRLFVSTCTNCPALDHIYHFETVDDIRALIAEQGLRIEAEAVIPSEELGEAEIRRCRLDVMYAAILA